MVHYDPPIYVVAQIPSPVCPKCGSHRTVIVGRSNSGETIVLRCNACGARSEIPADSDASAGFSADPLPTDIQPLVREAR